MRILFCTNTHVLALMSLFFTSNMLKAAHTCRLVQLACAYRLPDFAVYDDLIFCRLIFSHAL